MACKRCGYKISVDDLFCSHCGLKVKSNTKINKITILSQVIGIFIASIVLIALTVWAYKQLNLGTIFEKPNTNSNQNIKNVASNTPKFETPEYKEKEVINKGFFTDVLIDKDKYYYLDNEHKSIVCLDIPTQNIDVIFTDESKKFFVSQDYVYILNTTGIIKKRTGVETKIIDKQNLSNVYISEEFIFYTIENENGSYTLFRNTLDGLNELEVKQNILNYNISDATSQIYYTAFVSQDSYDKHNQNQPYKTIESAAKEGEYLTLFVSDFAGNAVLKAIEKLVEYNSNSRFLDVTLTDNFITFIISENNLTSLCVLNNDKTRFELIEKVKDYYSYNGEIFYTTPLESKPYIYDIIRYNPILNQKTAQTEIFDYKSIKVENNQIYIVLNNTKLIVCNLELTDKRGLADVTEFNLNQIGDIIKADSKNIYFSNAIISQSGESILYIDKSANNFRSFENTSLETYLPSTPWIEAYFKFLTSGDIILNNNVFALADVNGDKIYELLVGEKNNLIANNNYYTMIPSTKVYTYIDGQVEQLNDIYYFKYDTSINKFKDENKLIGLSQDGTTSLVNGYIFDDNFYQEPYLKIEFKDNKNHFYKYIGPDQWEEISNTQYFEVLDSIISKIEHIRKYDIDISNVVTGLYFNDYTKYYPYN